MKKLLALLTLLAACAADPVSAPDATAPADAASPDATPLDASADAAQPDAAQPDATLADATLADAGELSFCAAAGACSAAADCGEPDIGAPSNCEGCVDYNRRLCAGGACVTPERLPPGEPYTIVFDTAPDVPTLRSLAAIAVSTRAAGPRNLTCADVLGGKDLTDRCLNTLDSRLATLVQVGQTYSVGLSGFATGERTLFVVYGYAQDGARGAAVGVSCLEAEVPPPSGGGPRTLAGGTMQRI